MVAPWVKVVFPFTADMERMKKDGEGLPITTEPNPSKRRRRSEPEDEIEEDPPVWTGNPFWLINFWYYLKWIVILVVLSVIIWNVWDLLAGKTIRFPILGSKAFNRDQVTTIVVVIQALVLVVFAFKVITRFWTTKIHRYILSRRKLVVETGFAKRKPLRAFINRVKDYTPETEWYQRPFGRSSYLITMNDDDMSEVRVRWIKKGKILTAWLDHLVYKEELRLPAAMLIGLNRDDQHHNQDTDS